MIESPLITGLTLYATLINSLNLALWFVDWWVVITVFSFYKSRRA